LIVLATVRVRPAHRSHGACHRQEYTTCTRSLLYWSDGVAMDHRVLVTDRCVANGQRQKTLALSRSRSPARRSSGDLERQRVVKQIASLRGYLPMMGLPRGWSCCHRWLQLVRRVRLCRL